METQEKHVGNSTLRANEVATDSLKGLEDAGPKTTFGKSREAEEGEIIGSPRPEGTDEDHEGKWSEVTFAGGRKTNKPSSPNQGLVYGQVRISSPSRYAALCDQDESGEIFVETDVEANKRNSLSTDVESEPEKICNTDL